MKAPHKQKCSRCKKDFLAIGKMSICQDCEWQLFKEAEKQEKTAWKKIRPIR
jgi:predicted amidophosphoribosyltransferase